MLSLTLLMLMLGVANWFATTLIVESELFRPLREWVGKHAPVKPVTTREKVWHKIGYLAGCHMCAGTWVALTMALFVPWVVGGLAGYLLTALVIKGIGHLVLLLNNMGNAAIELNRAKATEAMMGALPDLGSLLGALERTETLRNRASRDENHGATEAMFDMGRMPPKNEKKFEPFDPGAALQNEAKRRPGGLY